MQLNRWDAQSGALFTSSFRMRARAWWCHCHGNGLCLRLQNQTLHWLQEAAAIHQKSKLFIIRPEGMIKPYTSHALKPLLKQLLHRPLMSTCVYTSCSVCACVKSCMHQCACHDCVSKRYERCGGGDSAHYLRHQPDSPRAGLTAGRWGPGGQRVWWLRSWLDSCLNRCLTCSWGLVTEDKSTFHLSPYKVECTQTCCSTSMTAVQKCWNIHSFEFRL